MPLLTDNYYEQGPRETMAEIPRHGDGPKRIRITHILQPYATKNERHRKIQELTFETIRIAVKEAAPFLAVRCVCVPLSGERDVIPPDFLAAAPLTRTVIDIAEFQVPRNLPLVFDILDNGMALPDSPSGDVECEDFIIFTNTDIHLLPHFYLAVAALISAGYDVMTINRRTIGNFALNISELPQMFGEYGVDHPGVDCFVFPRQIYRLFVRNNACVGMIRVMRGLVFNLVVNARRYLVLTRAHLTFHIGDDREWNKPRYEDYRHFNTEETTKVISALAKDNPRVESFIMFLCAINSPKEFILTAMDAAGIPRSSLTRFTKPFRRSLLSRLKDPAARKGILRAFLRRFRQAFIFPIWSRLPEWPKRLVRMTLYGRSGSAQ